MSSWEIRYVDDGGLIWVADGKTLAEAIRALRDDAVNAAQKANYRLNEIKLALDEAGRL